MAMHSKYGKIMENEIRRWKSRKICLQHSLMHKALRTVSLFDKDKMDKLFWYCCKKHVQLCMPNYNKWCSVMFLFSFLAKASEFVLILSQQYLQLNLTGVASAVQLILDFYREMPGPHFLTKSCIKLSKQRKHRFSKHMWPYGRKKHTHTQVKSPPSDPCAI